MTVEELIEKLKAYPPHYKVEALFERDHYEDLTAEIVGVTRVDDGQKIVSIELGAELLSDAEPNPTHFADQVE
jgi:hypothetical protein